MGFAGPMKPMPIGARMFCGENCEEADKGQPIAMGHKFGVSKAEYQVTITKHYTDAHHDLHYPLPQEGLDQLQKYKNRLRAHKILEAQLKELGKLKNDDGLYPWEIGVGGGVDFSGSFRPVTRPRELPDFTEFDFPDANLADAGTEEIELDQLISIQARQGRRFLGVELQNLDIEFSTEFLTAPDNADLDITLGMELNTRTGAQNLDDPENIWRSVFRQAIANVEATAGTGAAITGQFSGVREAPPGGVVYVSPRLFFRVTNSMDRQIDTGDLMALIATVSQRLSSFLLFELLEQYSGLFGLT